MTRTIGLCMIVRDEQHVIRRCLDSVRPLIDYVLIVDTGSKDRTQDVVREWLVQNQVPGEVIEEPWRDFAYNRSHALACLRKRTEIDFAFIMDADDVLVLDEDFDPAAFKSGLRKERYGVELRSGRIRYWRTLLCRNDLEFRFSGVLHEFLEAPTGVGPGARVSGFHVISNREGARSRDPEKYQKDARTLEHALLEEQDPRMRARYTFYLAQSYRDCGEAQKALDRYLERAGQGHWDEEVFYSLYQAARLQERLGYPEDQILDTYRQATQAKPSRAEARHGASRFCRRKKRFEEGFMFARNALAQERPESGLFLSDWVYEYGLLDELAVNGYWSGHYREALEACVVLLADRAMPVADRSRIRKNALLIIPKIDKANH